MAITIVFTSTSTKFNATNERRWNIGEDKPDTEPGRVRILQASGEELEHIRTRFQNIPDVVGNYTMWREPYSQFIWDNL